MPSHDEVMRRAGDVLERSRLRQDTRRTVVRAGRRAARAAKLGIGGALAVIVAALVTGLFVPLGIGGVILTFMAAMAAMCLGVLFSGEPKVKHEALPRTPLAQLPAQADRWLQSQCQALPAPARSFVDTIGVRLDQIAPQLATLDERDPAAIEVRRLIADELPELVSGYARVPAPMRREGPNGLSPDKQLVEGLAVVDSELKRMSEQLARGDLDKLATQGRYLELKYRGES